MKEEIYLGAKFVGDADNKITRSNSQLNSPFHDSYICDSIVVDVAANIGLFTKILRETFPDLNTV